MPKHNNKQVANMLARLDLGSSVAENDNLLENARVETSAFSDLAQDRVDLIPGTKGSGKSALFRIFVEFLPEVLIRDRTVVIAHGVRAEGDPVFQAFSLQFQELTETDFVDFWHIYLISLAHEQFIKGEQFQDLLKNSSAEIQAFRIACQKANIPEIKARKSLLMILQWSLHVLSKWRPHLKYQLPHEGGEVGVDLFGEPTQSASDGSGDESTPIYMAEVKNRLEDILKKSKATLWLMVDRLDEIFLRRSDIERKALRALLRVMAFFSADNLRLKIFLRDDMLDDLISEKEGFTALTHITSRQADTLRWKQEQLLTMVVKRIFASANKSLRTYLEVDINRIANSSDYRKECFYKIFPPTVFRGPKQSTTLDWIYNRCADGRGVVTPRDVLDLLIRAKQKQIDVCQGDLGGGCDHFIGSQAIRYGLEELSKRKRQTYLQAEFPHLWGEMKKFMGGKTDYGETALQGVLGSEWRPISEDLVAIGFLQKKQSAGRRAVYVVPRLYRHGMEITQGKA
jgi:hypothetical protein